MSNDYFFIRRSPWGIATLTLNRPDIHNAFDDLLIHTLTRALRELGSDPTVRVVVLAATGRSFSAGADLHWMQRMAEFDIERNMVDAKELATLMDTLNCLPKPTIARIQGPAIGGGVGLVACCDIAIAAESASFCLSEVKLGLIPAVIGPYVIAAMGQRAARRYFLSAERFSAVEAAHIGLIHEVVSDDELDIRLEEILQSLAKNGPIAMTAAKNLVLDIAGQPIDQSLRQATAERIATVRSSPEGREGVTAFLEKRKPSWIVDND